MQQKPKSTIALADIYLVCENLLKSVLLVLLDLQNEDRAFPAYCQIFKPALSIEKRVKIEEGGDP